MHRYVYVPTHTCARARKKEKEKSTYFSAAWQIVPHVSAMSSTNMATRSLTSPTKTMDATSFAFLRSLWIKANSTLSRSAIDVTLQHEKQTVIYAE
jgi:hypothetical protein